MLMADLWDWWVVVLVALLLADLSVAVILWAVVLLSAESWVVVLLLVEL
jgi:hypothetical protein